MSVDTSVFPVLLKAYGTHFDARDAVAFADLFTPDAIIVTATGKELTGHDRIVRMVERTPPGGQHEIVAVDVLALGDSVATTRTRFAATTAEGANVTGTYENTFSLTSKGWRISRHVIIPDE